MFHLLLLTHRALVKCPFLILIIINCHEHHDQKSHLVLFRDFALGAGEDSDHSSVTIPEVIMVTMMIILMTMIIKMNVNMMTLVTKTEKIAYLAAVWKGVSPYWGENIMRTTLQLSLFFC